MSLPRSTRVLAPVVLLLLLVAGLALARCDLEPPTRTAAVALASSGPAALPPGDELGPRRPVVTTVPPPPPTTVPAPPVPTTVRPRTTQPASAVDDAFWRRLANCESPSGANGGYNGYFQLAGSTAKAVGYHGGSYEEQLAAAKRWLAIIGVAKAGTRAGWPVCWWVALRG